MTNKYAPIISKLQGRYSDTAQLGPTLDEAHLHKIESQLGYQLPEDYREFLRDFAGIMFDDDPLFTLNEEGYLIESSISTFYGSNDDHTLADTYHDGLRNYCLEDGYKWYPGLHLVRDISTPVEEMGWPEELLCIACDAGGNEICLALFGRRPNAVFFWRNAPFGNSQNFYLIADSFDEFLHKLRPMTEQEKRGY